MRDVTREEAADAVQQGLSAALRGPLGHLVYRRLAARERVSLYRKLASLQRTGLPVEQALQRTWGTASVRGRRPWQPLALKLAAIHADMVHGGLKLYEALGTRIPPVERALIAAGERGHALAESLQHAVELIAARSRLQRAVSGLGYPCFILVGIAVVLYIFGSQMVPLLSQTLPVERWQGTAASLATAASLVERAALPGSVLLVAAVAALWSRPRWCGRSRLWVEGVPPWSVYRLQHGVALLLSLAMLMRAGTSDREALQELRRTAEPYLRERIDGLLRCLIEDGLDLGSAFSAAGHGFPSDEIAADLEVFGASADFVDRLALIAAETLEETVWRLEQMARRAETAAKVAGGLMAGWVLSGIFSLYEQLGQGFRGLGMGF